MVGGAGLDRDGLVDRLLALGKVLHEVDQTAVGLEGLLLCLALPLVHQGDLGALVEEGQLAEPFAQRLEAELQRLDEDLGVRPELHPGPRLGGGLALGQLGERLAVLVALAPGEAVALHLHLEPGGQAH